MYRRLRLFSILMITLFYPLSLFSATINVPADQPSIQAGIDAAVNGDTVLVAERGYPIYESIDFNGKAIVVKSENGYTKTVLHSSPGIESFFFQNGEDSTSVIDGFTIRITNSNNQWEIACINGSSPKIKNCLFTKYNESKANGIICIDSSAAIIEHSIFYNIYGHAVGIGEGCNILIRNSTFVKCGQGVIKCGSSDLDINNSIIAFNGITELSCEGRCNLSLTCCNVFENYSMNGSENEINRLAPDGNISVDPLFCDMDNLDFHISYYSQCSPELSPCGELIGALEPNCQINYICGDVDNNKQIDINDLVYLTEYYFNNGPYPYELLTSDINCDMRVGIIDIVYLNKILFHGGTGGCCQ